MRGDALRLPYTKGQEDQWDKLWVGYFRREPQQLALQDEVSRKELPVDRDGMIDDDALFISCDPAAIRGMKVLEVGCGAGFLAKLIAKHTKQYVGIDWSGLALTVARHTCPTRTTWIHPTDERALRRMAGEIDSVVARHFMIHQNWERTTRLLAFERAMLRSGGRIYADLWHDNPAIHDGHGVFEAKTREKTPPNAVYRYTEHEIETLATESRLQVADVYERPDKLRKFVTFEKTGR